MSTTAAAESSENKMCPICFERPCDSITMCAHTFCRKCILTHLGAHLTCPVCRSSLSLPGAATLSHGEVTTKMRRILDLLKPIKQRKEKALLFALSSALMKNINTTLKVNGIQSVIWDGTTAQKTRAYQSFVENDENNDVTALVLPLNNTTSGISLTCASHVIFCHP